MHKYLETSEETGVVTVSLTEMEGRRFVPIVCCITETAQREVNISIVLMNSNEQIIIVLFSIIHPGTPGQILHSYFLINYFSVKICCIKDFERQRKP